MHPRGHELSPKQPLLHITASLFMRETSRIISTSSHCHRLQVSAVTPSCPAGGYKTHQRKGVGRAASDHQRILSGWRARDARKEAASECTQSSTGPGACREHYTFRCGRERHTTFQGRQRHMTILATSSRSARLVNGP